MDGLFLRRYGESGYYTILQITLVSVPVASGSYSQVVAGGWDKFVTVS